MTIGQKNLIYSASANIINVFGTRPYIFIGVEIHRMNGMETAKNYGPKYF